MKTNVRFVFGSFLFSERGGARSWGGKKDRGFPEKHLDKMFGKFSVLFDVKGKVVITKRSF